MTDWFGFVNFNKPSGWSSRQAVDHLKPLVRPAKIGHAGTLDPLASGVLVICIGPATRLVPYLHDQTKEYRAAFELGCTSPSDDIEGEVEKLPDAPVPTRQEIEAVLPEFVGTIVQVPSAFSAIRVGGRRAYDLARRGQKPEVPPRKVEISHLALRDYRHPHMELDVCCGTGTYIRALGRDIAQALGSCAVMTALTRTRVGPFRLEAAVGPDTVTRSTLAEFLSPPQSGLVDMPRIVVTDGEMDRLQRGLRTAFRKTGDIREGAEVAVLTESGRLGLIAQVSESGELQPRLVFRRPAGRP